jgi:Helix-turn-helix
LSLPGTLQTSFLEQIRQRIPPNLSLADALAEVLNMSRDSAYRRIRGETVLSLDEVKTLCNTYGVSLDALLSPTSEMVSFRHQAVDHRSFTFAHWLKSILEGLEMLASFPEKDKEIVYYAKDMPVFYYFSLPELSAFKMFFWMKTALGYPEYQKEKFKASLIPKDYIGLGERIWNRYSQVFSTELWSDETLNVTLKQIEYYMDCGYFVDPKDAALLLDQFSELVGNERKWAAAGSKGEGKGKLNLYKNEILIAENTILFKMGDKRRVYLTHNIADMLVTSHEQFCQTTEHFINNLINKAILISNTGEKERSKFFNQLDDKIKAVKQRLT